MLARARLYLAPARAIVSETLVRPRNVVVREVRAKHASQVVFVKYDDAIEAFAANGADDALGEWILPGSARCDDNLANGDALDPALEVGAVDGIAIAEQGSVTPMWMSSRRWWRSITKPKRRRNVRVGTTKKSMAAIS